MLDILLENGSMTIKDCGDSIEFVLYDDDGKSIKRIAWDSESIVDMVFIED